MHSGYASIAARSQKSESAAACFAEHTEETLKFLQERGLTYVSIDGPRSRVSVPSLPALTSPTAVFRLHRRNFEGFIKQLQGKAPTVAEKYDYLYKPKELEEDRRPPSAPMMH